MTFSPEPSRSGGQDRPGEAEIPRRVFSPPPSPPTTTTTTSPMPMPMPMPTATATAVAEAPRPVPVPRPRGEAPTPEASKPEPALPPAGRIEPGAPAAPGAPAGPAVPGERVDWATVPRVNLLPQEIIDARRFRRLQRGLAGLVVLVLALCGLLTAWAQSGVGAAEAEVTFTRTQTLDLQRQQARFAEVPKVSAELEAARIAREQALGVDILWYRFLTDLAVNTPDGSVLATITISVTGGGSTEAAGSAPLTPAGLGTVKVSGEAGRYTDVAAWLDAAGLVNGLAGAQLQSATRSADATGTTGTTEKINFSGTAVVTAVALSRRYDRRAS